MPLYYPKLCPEAVKKHEYLNHDRCHLGLENNAKYPKQRRWNYTFVIFFYYNRRPKVRQHVCKQQPNGWMTCSVNN
jgi:hypothetical protein